MTAILAAVQSKCNKSAEPRKPLSKKTRFDVFKRDGFKCQYCGMNPPQVTLEVDHIVPVVAGGKNIMSNLLTACFDCNRGKGATGLTCNPQTVSDMASMKLERLEQLKAYDRLLKREQKFFQGQVDQVEEVFRDYNKGFSFNEKFRKSVALFIEKLGVQEVCEAMRIASFKSNRNGAEGVCKYFCAVCWTKIRETNAQ